MKPEDIADIMENEPVFRNMLKDMVERKASYVPQDLNASAPLAHLVDMYCPQTPHHGRFCITGFARGPRSYYRRELTGDEAVIGFQDVAPLSGGGLTLKYKVMPDDSVEYAETIGVFMC